MENANIFLEYFKVLIWPLTLLFVFWIGRKQFKLLIPLIQKIKYKEFEIEFSKNLDHVRKDVEKVTQVEKVTLTNEPELYNLIEDSPASGVIKAWKSLELTAKKKAKQLLPPDETFQDPLSRPLVYLEWKGTFVPSTASAIHKLRMLQNQVYYAEDDAISTKNAIQYATLTKSIQKQIDSIIELPKVSLTKLTYLILQLNLLIDSKNFEDISIKEVSNWIENRNVIPSLKTRTEGYSDFSFFNLDGPNKNFITFYHDQMYSFLGAFSGDEGRKWGVNNLGLCLLLAWTNEIIQQGSGWHPSDI